LKRPVFMTKMLENQYVSLARPLFSTPFLSDTLEQVASLYERIIDAGVHRAASIKVAEAAKVIENTQRDLNIALMNELALIFDRLGVDLRNSCVFG